MKARLLAILCGRAGWSDYEDIVKDIFKDSLFPKFITEPLTQEVSPLPDFRRDILLPLTLEGNFWHYLSVVYKGSIIIVECKNYCDTITPDEVHSALKYLTRPGVADIAFIVSRLGPNPQAFQLAIDYYKTVNKLFIFLNDTNLNDLIDLSGKPDEATNYLRDIYNGQKARM